MKTASKLIATSLLLSLLGCSVDPAGYATMDGGSVRFEDLRGKVVLVNYWAEWCKPCREEIPELNAFQDSHGDRVQLLAVNFDGVTGELLQQQAKALGIGFPVLAEDPRGKFAVKPSGVLPETLVIGPEGDFQKVLLGPQNEEKLTALLEQFTTTH